MPDDPRVVDSTGALELQSIPKRMLVIGGGIIGLEMATVYSTLGTRIDVVEMLDGLMPGADRDLVKVWEKMNAPRFDQRHAEDEDRRRRRRQPTASRSTFEGEKAPTGPQPYDLVLVAVGRSPNGKKIGADKAGVAVTDRGFITVDKQMRTNVPHIFAIGDIVGQPMLAHKAVHEGARRGRSGGGREVVLRRARRFRRSPTPIRKSRGPGSPRTKRKAKGIKYGKAVFPWAASGRAIANGRDEGFTKLLFDEATHRIIGGGIVGTHAGDLISEVALAIEMGADAGRHRQDDPSASDARRIDRHGGRSVRRRMHRPAAGEEEVGGDNHGGRAARTTRSSGPST